MVEPIRKPVRRPRPPHPHTQSRPVSLTLLPQPAGRTAPLSAPPFEPGPDPLPTPAAALAPPEDRPLSSTSEQATRKRSARGLLLAALALHAGALLAAWSGAAADLGPAELLLAGCVLLSGGMMLVLGRR